LKNFKDKLVKNQKIIIYGIITVSLLIVNYTLFLKPTISSLSETMPKLAQMRRQFADSSSLVASIPRYKAQIEHMREGISLHGKKFSTSQEISELLKDLSDMAKDSNVKIISIRPHPAIEARSADTGSGAYQKFPISIRAICGYHQLGAFLNKLENDDTFMRVSDIKIEADQNDLSQHVVNILVNTYVLSEA
jgi:Tfp pilus assembly protein PilO